MDARQKMMFSGTQSLNNAELLSLVIGTSESKAREVLEYSETVAGGLGYMEVKELTDIYGIGESKACSIVAATELGKRLRSDAISRIRTSVRDSKQVASMLMDELMNEKREHFVVIGLNSKLCIEWKEVASIGNLDSAPVHPREIFSKAIRRGSAAVIVAHNHPSGDVTPSSQDIDVTQRLKEAGELIGIKVIDHLILGNGKYVSMRSEGFI